MMATSSSILPLLRRAAPNLTRHFFTCTNHARKPATLERAYPRTSPSDVEPQFKSLHQTPFLQAFRSKSTLRTDGAVVPSPKPSKSNPVLSPARGESHHSPIPVSTIPRSRCWKPARWYSMPKFSDKKVAWWLYGSAASVFGIVVFGALTRLTESGLSITEWRPVTGTRPPLSAQDWDMEFQKYKASPEFQRLNPNMDLASFKEIFWMEWIHRLWGRAIGLTFFFPTIYFIARKRVSAPVARNLLLINCLIGLQGFVGWWMVKSGLKDDLFAQGSHPRVSQYRLAVHLGLAFTVYTSMLWNGLSIFRERRLALFQKPKEAQTFIERLASPKLRAFRVGTFALSVLIFTTAISGAFVAGLDAGLIYNEFPYMGLGLAPPKAELWNPFYSRMPPPHADLWWRNIFENPSLVQLDHRILATTTFTALHALFLYARFSPSVRTLLPKAAKTAFSGALLLVWCQVLMGIGTLIYLVPTPLAAAHQAGSLALLTSVVVLGSRVWTPPRLARLIRTMPHPDVPRPPVIPKNISVVGPRPKAASPA